MSQIDLVAIISPKEGKAERVAELLNEISAYVKANEPGTLKYEIHQETNQKSGAVEIIMMESYKDKAAIVAHGASEQFKAFGKKVKDEDLIAKPMQLKFLKNVGGFSSRL
ncbi:hypothetical protein DSL72_007193 [Monilinia vaccinii-corymbosi]|uniref:ABM domain-containing protein n=1 Tax=Monilinia vaccinii-corymbosi TaxID=61207 RepID=A0A8A3PM95_9HELO|nr:hypothetical protein DSL72_007193 [Monilinia vaccinii-corymbosi]